MRKGNEHVQANDILFRHHPPHGRPRRTARSLVNRIQSALQRRPRAGARGEAQLDDVQLRRALDQHGSLHSDLHARVGADRLGDELAAGALHDPARQHHCARSDPAQFASGDEIWNSLPGLRAGQLRRDRIEPAGVDAGARGLRLVRHSGLDLLRAVENWAAPYVLVMTAILLGWAIWRAQGLGSLLRDDGKFQTLGEFWPVFIPSLTAMIGFWATLSLNMPDFTRFGRSQREQAVGQVVALPTTMTIFAAMGVMITSAAIVIYPQMAAKDLWDPLKVVSQFDSVPVVAISMFTAVVATLAVNIAANVVSPANDF